ncbi:MAG: hypothetical protein DSY76_02590 [Bacteroidetes bacterium]|nr:MAG: hypothetical protein DSY76_02590 [Bacteroidota bacterium]
MLGDPMNNSSNKGLIFHTTNEGTDMQTAYQFKTGNNGYFPTTLVEESPNVVIGTTAKGGFYKCGVIFRFNILTGAYDKLVDFKGIDGDGGSNTLVLAPNGKYYGSTPKGGVNYTGNIFEFDPSNDSIIRIVGFYGPNGKGQSSPLLIIDTMLYGFSSGGGNHNRGVLFKVNLNTKVYTKLFDFSENYGSYPFGKLVHSNSGSIYGMCSSGGVNNRGIIFRLDPSTDSVFTDYSFLYQSNIKSPFGDVEMINSGEMISMTVDGSSYKLFQYDPISKQCSILKTLPVSSTAIQEFYFNEIDTNVVGIVDQYPYAGYNFYLKYDIVQDTIINVFSEYNKPFSMMNRYPIKINNQYLFSFSYGSSGDYGSIAITNAYQDSLDVLKEFTDSLPKMPIGALLYHSNGSFIGVSTHGGVHDGDFYAYNGGVIYSYNPSSNKLKPLFNFPIKLDSAHIASVPDGNLVELSSGDFLGTTRSYGGVAFKSIIYEYNYTLDSVIVHEEFETDPSRTINRICLTPIGNDRFLGTVENTVNKPNGALFLYDFNLDTTIFIHVFSGGNDGKYPRSKMTEVEPGMFVGSTLGSIYKYDINTATYTSVPTSGTDAYYIGGDLAVDANKYIYGITCDGYQVHIVRFTDQLDSITYVCNFDTVPGLGITYFGGGFNYSNNGNFYCIDQGSLLEYNPILNKLTQKSVYYPASTGYLTLAPTSLGFESIPKAKSLISVIPNPADNYIMIKSDINITYVNIYNSEGKLVLHKETSPQSLPIDISIFKSGLYLLEATTEKSGVQYSKFIKK